MGRMLLTGVTGMTGSYLVEKYLKEGYEVAGIVRRTSTDSKERLAHLDLSNVRLYDGDITDFASLLSVFNDFKPTHVINCAAQSYVAYSFNSPLSTYDITCKGALNLLEIIRLNYPDVRFLQLSSSEMMGATVDMDGYQRETTRFRPCSPYGVAKLSVHHMLDVYRRSYDLFLSSVINFNKESVRRGEHFVTRKISKYVGKLYKASNTWHELGGDNLLIRTPKDFKKLKLGNIESSRDWVAVEDAVEAMHLVINHKKADDFVVATGLTWTVKDFLERAFRVIDQDYREYVEIDLDLYRPCEVTYLKGDYTKIKETLGWEPKIDFDTLVKNMVEWDIKHGVA